MELATPVDSRTKEPFAMDDQSSVTSHITYQATFDEKSDIESLGRSTPKNSPSAKGPRDSYVSERESRTYENNSISEQQQDSTEKSVLANLMPTPRNNARGRSKSPRPTVSAETKARWAMLKSLAGVSKEEDVPETEADEEKIDVSSDRQRREQQSESRVFNDTEQFEGVPTDLHDTSRAQEAEPEPYKNAGLIPLHLGDNSDSASVERYLESLKRNPHIDNRGLQEGLQASKRLSSDYTKVQLNRTRSRGRSSAKDSTPKADHVLESGLAAKERIARGEIRTEGHNLEHSLREAKMDIEGDFHKDARKVEADLHKLGHQDVAKGTEHGERGLEGVARFVGSELHGPDVRHDIRRGERDLKEGLQKLEGNEVVRDFQKGRHDLDAGFKDAERAVESIIPGLNVGQEIRRGEHDFKEGLQWLEGERLRRDIKKGTIDLEHDIKGAERAVERISPGHNILQEVRRDDHDLDVGFKVAEEAVEGILNGSNLRQDLRRGEHELGAGINSIVKSAEDMLPGFNIERDIREGEHVLKDGLLGEVRKVENMLPGHDLYRDISRAERELTNTLHDGVKLAEREGRTFEDNGLRQELGRDGRSIEHSLGSSGRSALGQVRKDDQVLGREAGGICHPAENMAKDVRGFANESVRKGENAINQATKAVPDLRSSNNREMQDRERAGRNAPSKWSNVPAAGYNFGQPSASNLPMNTSQPSMSHPLGLPAQHSNPGVRRADERGDNQLQVHRISPLPSHQSPNHTMAQPGQARPPTKTQQLPPSPFPAASRAPFSAANESARRHMPTIPNQSRDPGQRSQIPTQGTIGHTQPLRPNDVRPGPDQPAVRPVGSNTFRPPQQRRGEGSIENQNSASSPANPHGDRHQSSSNDQPPQLRQPSGLTPSTSKAQAPNETPLPHVDPRNTASQHRQDAPKPGHTNEQQFNRALQQQAVKPSENIQQFGQKDSAHFSQENHRSQAELRNSEQREQQTNRTEHLGNRQEVLKHNQKEGNMKEAQRPSIQKQAPSLEQNSTLRAPQVQKQQAKPPCRHEAHEANACPYREQGNATVKRQQMTAEPPSAVSGPQQMLNIFKARSDASIDAAGGYPGFIDRESAWLPIEYLADRNV